MKEKSYFRILLLISILPFSGCTRGGHSASSGKPTIRDVYVAGYENNGTKDVAKIWKNGVATPLTNGANNAYALSVYVSGTDVYVAGFEYNGVKETPFFQTFAINFPLYSLPAT